MATPVAVHGFLCYYCSHYSHAPPLSFGLVRLIRSLLPREPFPSQPVRIPDALKAGTVGHNSRGHQMLTDSYPTGASTQSVDNPRLHAFSHFRMLANRRLIMLWNISCLYCIQLNRTRIPSAVQQLLAQQHRHSRAIRNPCHPGGWFTESLMLTFQIGTPVPYSLLQFQYLRSPTGRI